MNVLFSIVCFSGFLVSAMAAGCLQAPSNPAKVQGAIDSCNSKEKGEYCIFKCVLNQLGMMGEDGMPAPTVDFDKLLEDVSDDTVKTAVKEIYTTCLEQEAVDPELPNCAGYDGLVACHRQKVREAFCLSGDDDKDNSDSDDD